MAFDDRSQEGDGGTAWRIRGETILVSQLVSSCHLRAKQTSLPTGVLNSRVNTGESRRAFYERRRTALVGQLRGGEPPYSQGW